jgi:hypothetical protein
MPPLPEHVQGFEWTLTNLCFSSIWALMTITVNRLLIQNDTTQGTRVIVSYGDSPIIDDDSWPDDIPRWSSFIEMDSKNYHSRARV